MDVKQLFDEIESDYRALGLELFERWPPAARSAIVKRVAENTGTDEDLRDRLRAAEDYIAFSAEREGASDAALVEEIRAVYGLVALLIHRFLGGVFTFDSADRFLSERLNLEISEEDEDGNITLTATEDGNTQIGAT
jgi:hypothetical protein